MKKYIIIILILLILLNISCIYATENNTDELKVTDENNHENILYQDSEKALMQSDEISQTNQEILTQNQQDGPLSDFSPHNTQITLTIKDVSDFETTGNITINMHFSFSTIWHDGEFPTYDINVYENNTIIKKINIGDENLPEVQPMVTYTADVPFNYTLHSNSYLTTSLFGVYSNTLKFENIKPLITNLNNTQIIIDNIYASNETWTNSVESLRKAIKLAENNGCVNLNNLQLIQNTAETIHINKNLTIVGNDASFLLQNTLTLLEISQNAQVTLINLTFNGNNNYVISNKGKLLLINCTFKDNSFGLINNDGELEISNCLIQDINQFYQTRTINNDGLITNNGILKITKTKFNNNNPLPYNFPIESTTLKGIFYNNGTLTIRDVNFTNINYRILYNDGKIILNSTLFDNIISTSTSSLYLISTNKQLNPNYTYNSYQIKRNAKTMDGGAIYNNNSLNIINSRFNQIAGSNGGAIYNTNNLTITNTTLQSITGSDGGAIYNTNNLTIKNTTLQSITGSDGGAIYNTGQLMIDNSIFNNTQLMQSYHYGGAIYTEGECIINNSIITESKIDRGYGGGIYNQGTLIINNTIISKCSGNYEVGGVGIHNDGIMTITNSQITNNNAPRPLHITKYVEQPNGDIFTYITNVYAGAISNSETGKATITKSIIKDNTIYWGTNGNWNMYYGIIKNDGNMEISSCIFDNNSAGGWDQFFGGQGSINLYNTGKLTVMYTYLLNTRTYSGSPHDPVSFLYNTRTSTLNYNFYCLNPASIIENANPNYYFIPAFEEDYYPVKLNENINITLTLGLTNGRDKMDFYDWDKLLTPGLNATITTLNENGEYINLTTLLKDKFTFNFNYTNTKAIYTICSNILSYKNTAVVDVGKEFPEMTVTYNNITYNDGNNITFHIKVTGNLTNQPTGNITFAYNSKKVTLNLADGECNYTITETLKPANYTMRIDYNGDGDYFRIIKQHFMFTVHKIPTNITITAKEIKVDQKGEITITVSPAEAKLIGYLYLTKGDIVRKFNADTQGTRTLKPQNFVEGVWNATVIFSEDEYYMGGSASTLFIVSRYPTNITLACRDVKAGEPTATLNITISPGNVRGNAILQINGINQTIFINNTMTPITVTDLQKGTYHVRVFYPGDSMYLPSNASTIFSVARITSKLTVDIIYNENLTGEMRIKTNYGNCTGEVGIYINNDLTVLNLTGGEISTKIKFKRGTNYIYVHYNGDDYYSISSWNTTRFLDGKPQMTLETQDLVQNQPGYVRIILKDIGDNPYEYTDITVEFDRKTSTLKTDENGTVYYPVQTHAGTYEIRATYNSTSITKTVTVGILTMLRVNIESVNEADDLIVHAELTDSDSNPLSADVILKINDKYYKVVITNGKGSRNLGQFTQGTYTYDAIYPGGNLLYSTNATGSFKVNKDSYKITGNKNIIQYYGTTKTYKIRLTNNNQPVKDEIITIKINKNTVKIKTDNQGYAALKLNLKAGKYTITATYKSAKASNKITVKPTLITKNKKIKKGKTLTYTAKLLNKNGKTLKNKKITFKINGKKYKAKTNKKGIAKIKIKNLKAGKYKIITTYGKQKNTNTITVKK